jgi:IS4 transposase
MTHTLCLDGCQTFGFTPNQFGVSVLRKALNGRTDRWQITGNFQMTREEARSFWKGLIKDGAYRA